MCGIFGYIGKSDAAKKAIDGLKKLEYRGYDSAGIAGIKEGKIVQCKTVGKVSILEELVKKKHFNVDLAIAHTRWATHGVPNEVNAHPHTDSSETIAIVHNGIIENNVTLRAFLQEQGIKFISDTDSEVVAHLLKFNYTNKEQGFLEAIRKTLPELTGSFAIACIHKDYPGKIFAFAHFSPLAVGLGKNEAFIASDPHAFSSEAEEIFFLSNKEIAVVSNEKIELFNGAMEPISKTATKISSHFEDSSKGSFAHYTLKEIYEQPISVRNALAFRTLEGFGNAIFDELSIDPYYLTSTDRILIIGCGSSLHAGLIAKILLEDWARLPVDVEIASEYRYRNPIVTAKTLVIAISQSGETADTLAAMREVQAKGVKVLALCNIESSTIAREADSVLMLRAGIEIGVCSTKAFTNQLVVLTLFALQMARSRHMSKAEGIFYLEKLHAIPSQVEEVLKKASQIELLAKEFASFDHAFFLGRSYMFPTALEGALKLKEIAYINATGYPAGEMKHGPIALISPTCFTLALCTNINTYEKIINNLSEVKARKGPLLAIGFESHPEIGNLADKLLLIPQTVDEFAPILASVFCQLFAYFIAKERGANIDQPRNLAKSVTVE